MTTTAQIVASLRMRLAGWSREDLEQFSEAFEEWCDEFENMEDVEDDDEDGPIEGQQDTAPVPSRDRWPGNIHLRKPEAEPFGDVAKLHAIAARPDYDSESPVHQAAYAAAIARRKAFGDLLEELGKIRPPYSRDMILDVVNSLDDPPWGTAIQDAPPGPEAIALLAGQWRCVCGWRNSDLRKTCRRERCNGRRP